MHRIAAMTAVPDMEKEKQRAAAALFPQMPFFPPATSTATNGGVFPSPLFPQQLQQFFLLQQQFLHLAQAQQGAQSQQSPSTQPRHELSPSLSTSSREDSPSIRKLQIGDDGCPICPVCLERLPENEWADHVVEERNKLISSIQGVKDQKLVSSSCDSPSDVTTRRKREFELQRIRNNQQKRLSLKRSPVLPSMHRESLTPFSRQSNEDSGSTVASPEDPKKEDDFGAGIKCSACGRMSEYGIVSGSFEQPRCQECFDRLRAQTGALPLSLGGAPLDMRMSCGEKLQESPLALVTSGPAEKRPKLEC